MLVSFEHVVAAMVSARLRKGNGNQWIAVLISFRNDLFVCGIVLVSEQFCNFDFEGGAFNVRQQFAS